MKTLSNKYERWYYSIISNSKNKNHLIYEVHHIHPTALGGLDIEENKVKLSFREHFICHLLLTKFLKDPHDIQLMSYPAYMMSCRKTVKSHQYAKLKEDALSFLKNRIVSEEAKKNMSIAKSKQIMHPNTKEALKNSRKNRKHTQLQRDTARNTCINIMSKFNKGKKHSVEQNDKMSLMMKGRIVTWADKTVATRKKNRELGLECTIWDVYSPTQQHFITKDLKSFSIEHSLPFNTLRQTNNRGVGKRGSCKGWLAESRGLQKYDTDPL